EGLRIALALRRGPEIVGVLLAGWDTRRVPLRDEELRIADGIAHVASLALSTAQLVGELERANRLKSEFVSTMSHELRTPLNVILGYAEMARDPSLDETTRDDCIVRAQTAGGDLLGLIESTLEVGRIEAGRDEPRIEPVDLAELWTTLGDACG